MYAYTQVTTSILVIWFLREKKNVKYQNNFNNSQLHVSSIKVDITLYLNKFKSPLPKDFLCQVWLELVQWVLKRRLKGEKFQRQ